MKAHSGAICILMLLNSIPFLCHAEGSPDCPESQIEAHVVEQFRIYGPLSKDREYFGFIYRFEGAIESAVTRGTVCRRLEPCEVKSARAASKIPQGAKVFGEWHTHPHVTGTMQLSSADVRGANANRHIRCYHAFFSTADGRIVSWNPNATAVSPAMEKSVLLGNYRR